MTSEENDSTNKEEELFEHFNIKVDKGQEFLRIDKYLVSKMQNASRSKLQQSAENGNILVNGNPVKSNYKVKPNDEIAIVYNYAPRAIELIPENIPLNIVFEDDAIIIVNKPPNFVVHPAYGNYSGTLVNALLYHFQNLPINKSAAIQESEFETENNTIIDEEKSALRPGLVHRLDKDTSGIMVIAKNEQAMTKLAKDFFNRDLDRVYYALVWGDFADDEGTITGNIGRDLKDRKKMAVFNAESNEGKHAVTHYKVLERFGYVTLIQCKLETGRTHQIRVHLKHVGHPLFNDATYGGDRILKGTTFAKYKQFVENCFKILPRQALHAKSLGFNHPITGNYVHFDSDVPDDMDAAIGKWRGYSKSMALGEV